MTRIAYLLAALVVGAAGVFLLMKSAELRVAEQKVLIAEQRLTEITTKLNAQALVLEETKQRHADAVKKITESHAQDKAQLERRAADTDAVLARLRNQLAKPAACAPAGPQAKPASSPNAATASRELLGVCAARYAELARQADDLRNRVNGLQKFIDTTK